MAKLTGEEREIILNALQEVGLDQKEIKGVASLSDRRLIEFADQFITNSDEEDDDEEIDDEDLDDEEVDSDEESEDDEDEEEVTGNSEDEEDDEESEDFEDEELVDNEEFEDEEEAVHNGCDSGMKKKKKKGATMNRRELTAQEWLDSAPPEISEVVNNAMAHARDLKANLIEKLTANLSGEKKKDMIRKLANNTLSQLQDLATLIPTAPVVKPQVRVPRQAVHIGAGGVTTNSKKEKDASEPLIPPTINWSELKDEFSGK